MTLTYDGKLFDVEVLDDGTLDTLIQINGREFRYGEVDRMEDGTIVASALIQAIDDYLSEDLA